jgi:hypothetical protein
MNLGRFVSAARFVTANRLMLNMLPGPMHVDIVFNSRATYG